MKQQRILMMAGGTGGHVFPALAVAAAMQSAGYAIAWLGNPEGIEANYAKQNNYQFFPLNISGLRGKGIKAKLLAPWKVLNAVRQASKIIREYQPDLVIGMGGYVSGPGGLASWLLRKPLLIHEQNTIAGVTNRILAKFAKRVMQTFPNTFKAKPHIVVTGNPVREAILNIPEPKLRFAERDPQLLKILVLGGSQGAQAINQVIPATLHVLCGQINFQVWHQTGKRDFAATQGIYKAHNLPGKVEAFIDDMAAAYAWADVVVARAGATTVCELAVAGCASILIPYPYAVDDHQTQNAKYLADQGAAKLHQESTLNNRVLSSELAELMAQPQQLLDMAQKARELAVPDATAKIVAECTQILNKQGNQCESNYKSSS